MNLMIYMKQPPFHSVNNDFTCMMVSICLPLFKNSSRLRKIRPNEPTIDGDIYHFFHLGLLYEFNSV